MMTVVRLWQRADRWLQENASMIALGSAIAVCVALWNTSSVYSLETTLHRDDCVSARARFVDVSSFWNSKSSTHGNHSSNEHDASTLWTNIAGTPTIRKDQQLATDVANVASTWQRLADDDASEASLDSNYVAMIARDFNRSCGDAPTPLPQSASATIRPFISP